MNHQSILKLFKTFYYCKKFSFGSNVSRLCRINMFPIKYSSITNMDDYSTKLRFTCVGVYVKRFAKVGIGQKYLFRHKLLYVVKCRDMNICLYLHSFFRQSYWIIYLLLISIFPKHSVIFWFPFLLHVPENARTCPNLRLRMFSKIVLIS